MPQDPHAGAVGARSLTLLRGDHVLMRLAPGYLRLAPGY